MIKIFIIDISALIYRPWENKLSYPKTWMLALPRCSFQNGCFSVFESICLQSVWKVRLRNKQKSLTTSCHWLFFLFNPENTKSTYKDPFCASKCVCHLPVRSLLFQCWVRFFRRKNGKNHLNYCLLQCLPSQTSSFLSIGVKHAYFLINLCLVVDCESQAEIFPMVEEFAGILASLWDRACQPLLPQDNYRVASLPVFTKLVITCHNLLSPALCLTLV